MYKNVTIISITLQANLKKKKNEEKETLVITYSLHVCLIQNWKLTLPEWH